jgi:hypothetical protein
MPLLCPTDNEKNNHQIIICDSEISKHAHKELFRYTDDDYVIIDETHTPFDRILRAVELCNSEPSFWLSKIHIVVNWPNLLRVSLWQADKPTAGDLFTILRNAGIMSDELQPFKTADTSDLFPWLYYGKRFDILRKICHEAKKQMEAHLKNRFIRVDCHLVAEDTKRIVASSL